MASVRVAIGVAMAAALQCGRRRVTTSILLAGACTGAMAVTTAARAEATRDRWLAGEVELQLDVADSGRIKRPDESARLSVRVDADAFVAVYAIDAEGAVRWLFPRFWEDDGWMEAGHRVRLEERGLAAGLDRSGVEGIVFVQAVASPAPFDWRALGVREARGGCEWVHHGEPLRVQGDPLEGFNEINRLLFECWDEAVFVTDAAAYHVGRHFDHPTYLCGVCAGRHRGYHDPWVQVRLDFTSEVQNGHNHSRRVHRPQYVYCAGRRSLGPGSVGGSGPRPRVAIGPDVKRRARDARPHIDSERVVEVARALRVEVPRRGATPPGPDSDARSGGRRYRQASPAVSGGDKPIASLAKLALASRVEFKREPATR